jgi:D-xylose transport system substrate-binding protein
MYKLIPKAVILVSVIIGIASIQAFRPDEPVKVGLSYSNTKQDRWLKDRSIFEKTVTQSGGKVLFEIDNSDTAKQVQQVKELIEKGIKVLVVVPGNADMSGPIIEMAHKAGIKVIAYDRLLINSDLDYYISYDNEKVGELQAKHVLQQKPGGNFVIISGPSTDNNSKLIKKGIMKVLNPLVTKGTVKIICDQSVSDWSKKAAFTMMDNFLTKNDKAVDAVLAANDDIAVGVINALKKHKMNGKVIVTGQDADLEACKEIISGNMSMTVYKPIKPLAYIAALTAISLAKNEPINDATDTIFNGKVKVPSIILTPFSIDKNTIQNVIIDGHLKEEDLFPKQK